MKLALSPHGSGTDFWGLLLYYSYLPIISISWFKNFWRWNALFSSHFLTLQEETVDTVLLETYHERSEAILVEAGSFAFMVSMTTELRLSTTSTISLDIKITSDLGTENFEEFYLHLSVRICSGVIKPAMLRFKVGGKNERSFCWVFFHKYHIRHFQWCLAFETEVLFDTESSKQLFNNTLLADLNWSPCQNCSCHIFLDDTISNTVLTIQTCNTFLKPQCY